MTSRGRSFRFATSPNLGPLSGQDAFDWSSTAQKLIYRTLLRSIHANKKIADDDIRASALAWTLVHPTRLTHGPAQGTFRADDRLPMKGNPTISRADAAALLHRAAHGDEWIDRSPVITD